MTDQPSIQIILTPDELKTLIHDAVRDALLEVIGEDLSTEPNFSPEIAERLRAYQQRKPKTISAAEVAKELDFAF